MVHRALASACAVFCALAPLAAFAQVGNPFEGDPAAIRAGAVLYTTRCADCHGPDAKGTRGPDLTRLWAAGGNDQRVFASIRVGVAGSIMPPSFAPDSEIWAIVAHLRSISTVPPFGNARGDAARGRAVFGSMCSSCHRVHGVGGVLGQDLSTIAQIRSREALAHAIRDPSAAVAAGYRAVTLITKSSESIQGVAKSEDAFSIQVLDINERLQGYSKMELKELTHEGRSLMPQFGPELLNENDFDDLLAFLGTLRAPESTDP